MAGAFPASLPPACLRRSRIAASGPVQRCIRLRERRKVGVQSPPRLDGRARKPRLRAVSCAPLAPTFAPELWRYGGQAPSGLAPSGFCAELGSRASGQPGHAVWAALRTTIYVIRHRPTDEAAKANGYGSWDEKKRMKTRARVIRRRELRVEPLPHSRPAGRRRSKPRTPVLVLARRRPSSASDHPRPGPNLRAQTAILQLVKERSHPSGAPLAEHRRDMNSKNRRAVSRAVTAGKSR